MGRHSRGGASTPPPPEPEPPARTPRYAPRSVEDTGTWDHSTYRVVDVGLPPAAPVTPRTTPGYADPRRAGYGDGPSAYGEAPAARPSAYGSRPSAYGDAPAARPTGPGTYGDAPAARPTGPGTYGGAARSEPPAGAYGARSYGEPVAFPLGGAPAAEPARRYGATRADLAAPPSRAGAADSARATPAPRPPADPYAGRRADRALEETGFLASPIDPYDSTPGLPPLGSSGAGLPPIGSRLDSGAGLPPLGGSTPGLPRLGDSSAGLRPLGSRADSVIHPLGSRSDSPLRTVPTDSRYGATRADLVGTDGATALQPSAPPEPDEVTDTGARRARSAFRLAEEPVDDDEPEDEHEESSLLVQWGVFVAQTLTGAAAGLGVWLGFYRLWSTWPLYAAPGVGVVAIVLLVTARTLRRRHGKELDLLTALVTYAVTTVLTVLPAAFALQSLA